jgi:hypothetical protein
MTREQFLDRLSNNTSDDLAPSALDLGDFFFNEWPSRKGTINLRDLAFRLKVGAPAKKGDEKDKHLILSTVHKAKGLEYRNVVVVPPNYKKITEEEVRVLYVAITRAKFSISLLPKNAVPFNGWLKRGKCGRFRYSDGGKKYLQVFGLEDFDLETLFIHENGSVDNSSLGKYLLTYQNENHYSISPESCNCDNDHNYALYLNSSLGPVRICAVSMKMKKSLDAMAWGNTYGKDGALLDMGGCSYQTIVHPLESPILTRCIGTAGIMVFPIVQGFYPLSRAIGE